MPNENTLNTCRSKLYSAVIADTLDTFGFHGQVVRPGLAALDSSKILCGFARVGLYMPIYHDDEEVRVYENEIALVDSLQPGDVAVLVCHGNSSNSPLGGVVVGKIDTSGSRWIVNRRLCPGFASDLRIGVSRFCKWYKSGRHQIPWKVDDDGRPGLRSVALRFRGAILCLATKMGS